MATFTNPDAVGMDPEKLEQVKQLFHAQIEQGLHPGAGLAVYRYGCRSQTDGYYAVSNWVTIWYKALDIVEKHATREVTHGPG